ncbi:bifunctional oligoribonuclease/PAP phosphatase NrnA [Deferribacter thermophilus]|uniref:DHH family phosphoesterase n=1 Tax=Deferribacter thermophilus TaxID=53573 RepID=UPI003C289EF6
MIDKILELVKPARKILILTHNNPDPDTIAAANGLKYIFYTVYKKRCTIAYDGLIGRAENRELVKECKIDMHKSKKLNFARYDTLILVDSQPTAGNVYIPDGYFPHIVIDHHNFRKATAKAQIYDIRNDIGSTSTIITEYIKTLGLNPDRYVSTALYYGIKTDTIGSGRNNSKADLEMMSFLLPKISLKKLSKIESPELPKYYFKNLKKAIENSEIIDDLIFCNLYEVRNADLIAETSDFLLRMRDIKWTFVIGYIDDMCYFSLRCKSLRKKVGLIALQIVRGLGTGGGHMKSAGGQISLNNKTYEEVVDILKKRILKKLGFDLNNTEVKNI